MSAAATAALLKAALRSNFGLSLLKHRLFVQKRDIWLVPLVFLGAAGCLPMIYLYVRLLRIIYRTLLPMGQQHVVLTFSILVGQILVLVFGLYYVLSTFYFSRDLEFLVSLPLRPWQVMASKFGVILVNEYLTIAIIVLPALVAYGIWEGRGVLYWLLAGLAYLLLPVIPLALSGLLVIGMMRLVNVSRKKDLFVLVGSLVLIAAVLYLQIGLQRTRDPGQIVHLIAAEDGLVRLIAAKFPPSLWATGLLAHGFAAPGPRNLALFGGGSIAIFLLLLWVAERLFYRGVIGLSERAAGRRRLTRDQVGARISGGQGPVRAVFRREWRLMNRTPIFLLNGVLSVVLIPVVLFFTLKGGEAEGTFGFLRQLGRLDAAAEILIAAAFFVVCGCLNGTASSTFSREGRQFWISKVIPVAPDRQAMGKFLHSYLVAILGTFAGAAVIVLAFDLGWGRVLPAALLSLTAGVLLTALNMAVDLARPLLDWTNPQKAMKQNLNVLIALALDVGILFGFYYVIKALRRAGLDGTALVGALFALLALLSAAAVVFLMSFARRRYPRIAA